MAYERFTKLDDEKHDRINEPGVRESIVEMALNGSGIRDTARVLGVANNTVSSHLKKALEVQQANPCVSEPGLSVEIARCLRGPETIGIYTSPTFYETLNSMHRIP